MKWEKAGVVGVDSGQIVICDPCYIDGQWAPKTEPPGHDPLHITKKGRARFPKANAVYRYPKDFPNFADPIPSLGGLSANDAVGRHLLEQVPQEPSGEFSYRGCCMASRSEKPQLYYRSGFSGAGVALSSGYGDGTYPVYIKRNKTGRIKEVLIKF